MAVHSPNLSDGISNYGRVLESALQADQRITDLRAGSRVAIVVDDASRWTPVEEALPILLPALHGAGVQAGDISISVAVGRHRPMDNAALRKRLGDDVVSHYRCLSPQVDGIGAYSDLGTTPENVPARVFRPVAEAGLRILVGSVLPHLQAGFGGGGS